MALDFLDNTIDITHLSVESPEKRAYREPFDAELEITDSDWAVMMAELKKLNQAVKWPEYLWLASSMKLACPDRPLRLNEDLNAADFSRAIYLDLLYEDISARGDWNNFLKPLEYLKLLFPDFESSFQEQIADWDHSFQAYQKELKEFVLQSENVVKCLFQMKLLFPKKFQEAQLDKTVNEEMWNHIQERLDMLRDGMGTSAFIHLASQTYILFERSPGLSPDDWTTMKNHFRSVQQEAWDRNDMAWSLANYMSMVAGLRILAAQKVSLDEGKLNIIDAPSSLIPEQPPVPNQRKF